jgi:hypothetical protein
VACQYILGLKYVLRLAACFKFGIVSVFPGRLPIGQPVLVKNNEMKTGKESEDVSCQL